MLVRQASHTKDSIGCWANKRRRWCTKNDSQHNHVCIALSHDDSQNLLSLRCAHNLLLREIFLLTHCMIMHIPLVRAIHYAICTMPWFSREHRWFPPQSYALWEYALWDIRLYLLLTVATPIFTHSGIHLRSWVGWVWVATSCDKLNTMGTEVSPHQRIGSDVDVAV